MAIDFTREIEEAKWLVANPAFKMRPANIREFVGPGYLKERHVRPGIMQALLDTFGEEVNPYSISPIRKSCLTGAIGIGKSTYAAIALSYMVHWVKCLKNPKEFFNLSEDSIIGFMMMSTTATLAKEVIFMKVKKRIENSEWFQKYAPLAKENERMQKQMRFEGDIWIVPGSSEETSFEGYDILGGIVDEGDSHKITERKNYAMEGYNTIESRIKSRFTDFKKKDHRGLIIIIGQCKAKSGFMLTKFKEFEKDDTAVAVRMSLWESYGWFNFTKDPKDVDRGIETAERDSFYYDQMRRIIFSKEAAQVVMNNNMIEVPMTYLTEFENDPVKALRDLGGIPPEVDDPFISQVDRILENQDLWHEKVGAPSPVDTTSDITKLVLPDWFRPSGISGDFRRVIHIDLAYASEGDALGLAMGHIPEKIIHYDEERPVVVFDLLLRLKASPGSEINFGDLREFIYRVLRDERGFEIDMVTMDGFNSVDFMQQLRKVRIKADYLSVDKSKAPYEDLREVINDRRCLHPKYEVHYRRTDTTTVNIAYKELSEVSDVGKKIDHPKDGSKDVADAMAGVVSNLLSNTKYTREAKTVTREDRTGGKMVMADSVNDLLGFDTEGNAVHSANAGRPVTFEEFARDQDKYLGSTGVPAADYNILAYGNGTPGYALGDDRVW